MTMPIFETMNTFEPAGSGCSLVADVCVQPPLKVGKSLGELIAHVVKVDGVTIEEIGGVDDVQHLRIETQSFEGNIHNASKQTIGALRDYHSALIFKDFAKIGEIFSPAVTSQPAE